MTCSVDSGHNGKSLRVAQQLAKLFMAIGLIFDLTITLTKRNIYSGQIIFHY